MTRRNSAAATTRLPFPGFLLPAAHRILYPIVSTEAAKIPGAGVPKSLQDSCSFVHEAATRITSATISKRSPGQIPKDSRWNCPRQDSLTSRWPAIELDQADATLLHVYTGAFDFGDEVCHQPPELRFMTDDCHDPAVVSPEPTDDVSRRVLRLQRLGHLDLSDLVLAPEDLGGLVRACQRTRRDDIDRRDELLQPSRNTPHLARAVGRERTQGVVTAGSGERFLVFSNRVSNDQQLHGRSGYGFFSVSALMAAGISNDAGSATS